MLRFEPRFLFLSSDPALVRAQLAGERVALARAQPLRDDVSTDEIIPLPAMVHFDATLGRWPYTGFEATSTSSGQAGGERPIGRDAVRYRQNADNVGLITSTDVGLIDRIARGESIDLEELLQGRDALAAAILRAGGLLRYGRAMLAVGDEASGVSVSPAPTTPHAASPRPRTLFEKVIERHLDGPSIPHGERWVGKGPVLAGRGRLHPRRFALHPRVLHGHGRAHARRSLRRCARAA
jgi:3-isopropylmalate/(R)-2-methylmalate dehydratase large subunit